MISRRLIQQDAATKLYRLGPGLFYLAAVAREGLEIRKIALPLMERLRDLTGENAILHELRDCPRVCLEKSRAGKCCEIPCGWAISFRRTRVRAARSLLAYLPPPELKEFLKSTHGLKALTPRTITDPKKIAADLARTKRQGYPYSCGERVMDGLCAISAPIFDSEGRAPYSLTITLTPFRLQAKGRSKLVEAVKRFADEISHKRGSGSASSVLAARVVGGRRVRQ
jgi:IclR family transcriptional regulator, acetate operon repressor